MQERCERKLAPSTLFRRIFRAAPGTVFCLCAFIFFSLSAAPEAVAAGTPGQGAAAKYFPLATGMNWVLTNPVLKAQFSFQVVSSSGNSYRVRCTTPWNTNDLLLTDTGDQYWMTGYGNATGL